MPPRRPARNCELVRFYDAFRMLLTHGHFDHVGFARGLKASLQYADLGPWRRSEAGCPSLPIPPRAESGRVLLGTRSVLADPRTHDAGRRARSSRCRRRRGLRRWRPAAGARRPRVIHTPGHTSGQCALLLSDRGVLLSGDALVTLDPYTGRRGPRLVAPAATADSDLALSSLDRLVDCGARIVLPGHGKPWRSGADAAVAAARRAVVDAGDTGS